LINPDVQDKERWDELKPDKSDLKKGIKNLNETEMWNKDKTDLLGDEALILEKPKEEPTATEMAKEVLTDIKDKAEQLKKEVKKKWRKVNEKLSGTDDPEKIQEAKEIGGE